MAEPAPAQGRGEAPRVAPAVQREAVAGPRAPGRDGSDVLQGSVGNRAVQRLLARPVQRRISLAEEQATFANVKEEGMSISKNKLVELIKKNKASVFEAGQ